MTDKNTRVRPVSDRRMQALIVKLTTGSEKERISATRTLGETGDARAVSALVLASQAESANSTVHFYASYALGNIRSPQAGPALMDALRDKGIDKFTRRNIIEALAAIGDPLAAPSLIRSLTGEDADARIRAVTALGTWKSKAAVPALIAALTDKASETKYDLGENGARYNPVTQYVCDEAATALGRIGDARAVPALSKTWGDEKSYTHTRLRAIKALGEIGGLLAVHSLLKALDSAECRREAVKALAMVGLPASPALLEALPRENQPFIIPALIDILRADEYLLPRCQAAQMLKFIAADHPEPSLRAALPPLRQQRRRDPAFQEALDIIEAATVTFKDLPVSAAAPPPDAKTLPRPAEGAPLAASVISPPGLWARLRGKLKVQDRK